jgi:hypothetical protein
MTLEEAKEGPHLRQWIYLEMAMDRLREVNNVRVFEDNLWHPGGSRRMY